MSVTDAADWLAKAATELSSCLSVPQRLHLQVPPAAKLPTYVERQPGRPTARSQAALQVTPQPPSQQQFRYTRSDVSETVG
jgi:hypothetical protein